MSVFAHILTDFIISFNQIGFNQHFLLEKKSGVKNVLEYKDTRQSVICIVKDSMSVYYQSFRRAIGDIVIHGTQGERKENGCLFHFLLLFVLLERCGNDPSAGSPTETLLRLHLPLNDEV
jgi:hypothetical protein